MELELLERRKFLTKNMANFASFPVKKIAITDEEPEGIQIRLHLRNGINGAEIAGVLISKKRIHELVGEEYVGFGVDYNPTENGIVILKKDLFRQEKINIRNTLDVLVEIRLIHQDTANEILACLDILLPENATRLSNR